MPVPTLADAHETDDAARLRIGCERVGAPAAARMPMLSAQTMNARCR